jgi:urease accessory protein
MHHQPQATSRTARDGALDLALSLIDGVTRPARAFTRPPLQLSRVRYDDPRRPGMAVQTLLTLGGVLAGDRNTMAVEVGEGAAARVVFAAATQVLAMPSGHAEQSIALRLGAGSRLEWLAEPTILFGDSELHQRTQVALAPGAQLALLDVLTPGRLARGELHRFRRYRSELEVIDHAGRLLAAEYADLAPGRRALDVPGVLRGSPVVGSLFLLGDLPDAERVVAQVSASPARRLGATVLPNGCGALVRALGDSASAIRAALLSVLADIDR